MALIDNLIAYWNLDEANGVRADSHGENDLADNNTVLSASDGGITVADFENSLSEFLSKAHVADLEPGGAYSFSLFFKPESLSGVRGLIAKEASAKGFLLYTNNASLVFLHQGTNGTSGVTLTNGTWYHIVCTYDGLDTSTCGKMYVNVATVRQAAMYPYIDSDGATFALGGRSPGVAPGYADGLMKRVGFWKGRALSETEVIELFASGAGLTYAEIAGTPTGTTVDASRSAEVHGIDSSVAVRDAEVHGIDSTQTDRDAEVTGQDTETASRDAETHGQALGMASRNAEITGTGQSTRTVLAELTGRATEGETRDVELRGQDTEFVSRSAVLHGITSEVSTRDAEVTGQDLFSADRSAEVTGQLSGQVVVTTDRDGELHGIDTAEASRSAEVTGCITSVASFGCTLEGKRPPQFIKRSYTLKSKNLTLSLVRKDTGLQLGADY